MAALSKAKPARTAPRWSFQERQAIEGDRPATVTRPLAALVAPGAGPPAASGAREAATGAGAIPERTRTRLFGPNACDPIVTPEP